MKQLALISSLWQNRKARWLSIVALVINVASWVVVLRFIPRTSSFTPLHYTIYFGINLTGSWIKLLSLPAIGLMAILSHAVIGRIVDHRTWQRLWVLLALVINILILCDILAVVYVLRVYSA